MSRAIKTQPCPRCQSQGNDTHGDNLVLWDNGHGHCFACGYHLFPKLPHPVQRKEDGPKSLLPFDFQREVPRVAWEWLLQYELPFSYWLPITGYSPSEERLVFRLGEYLSVQGEFRKTDTPLACSIGRRISTETPTNHRHRKWYVWGNIHKHVEIVNPNQGRNIVLVEDLISAHKVGQVNSAIALFGTEISPAIMYYLMHTSQDIIFWLDKDQEVYIKKKVLHLQTLLNKDINYIVTEKDPKQYTVEQIKTKL